MAMAATKTILLCVSIAAISACSGFASAAASRVSQNTRAAVTNDSPLVVKLERRKVQLVAGKELLQTAETAKPGDVLEEIATYTNRSSAPLAGVEATLPVPANTQLVPSSVNPPNARASVDGVTFSPMPLRRTVRLADGTAVEREVPAGEYRFLRWYPGKLDAKQSLAFGARFRVNSVADERTAAVDASTVVRR
jgi:uncharacterized repeat protein (TIGR01451 family)